MCSGELRNILEHLIKTIINLLDTNNCFLQDGNNTCNSLIKEELTFLRFQQFIKISYIAQIRWAQKEQFGRLTERNKYLFEINMLIIRPYLPIDRELLLLTGKDNRFTTQKPDNNSDAYYSFKEIEKILGMQIGDNHIPNSIIDTFLDENMSYSFYSWRSRVQLIGFSNSVSEATRGVLFCNYNKSIVVLTKKNWIRQICEFL